MAFPSAGRILLSAAAGVRPGIADPACGGVPVAGDAAGVLDGRAARMDGGTSPAGDASGNVFCAHPVKNNIGTKMEKSGRLPCGRPVFAADLGKAISLGSVKTVSFRGRRFFVWPFR
jgi:hypothetical protein